MLVHLLVLDASSSSCGTRTDGTKHTTDDDDYNDEHSGHEQQSSRGLAKMKQHKDEAPDSDRSQPRFHVSRGLRESTPNAAPKMLCAAGSISGKQWPCSSTRSDQTDDLDGEQPSTSPHPRLCERIDQRRRLARLMRGSGRGASECGRHGESLPSEADRLGVHLRRDCAHQSLTAPDDDGARKSPRGVCRSPDLRKGVRPDLVSDRASAEAGRKAPGARACRARVPRTRVDGRSGFIASQACIIYPLAKRSTP